ncbi:hypothetical protein NQ176_g10072 [Zarea fungicola]|uniref:Uncharacterized protein n=1 Tax=Zarea fungicola TaxID=93591 RepID=A0ACC1MIC4_9HYPO|nr:hypothetical protein NQ176_g10072 [Lecanicillium fungicola]
MFAEIKSYLEAMPQDAGLKPVPIILASLIAAAIALYWRISTSSKLPRINAKGAFEISDSRTKAVWMKDGANLIRDWFAKNPDKPVLIVTDSGPLTVLPPSMAQEIRNDSRLGFTEVVQGQFHSYLPGFEPFRLGSSDTLVQGVVRKDLTKQLAKVTGALAEETSLSLQEILTDDTEWHEANVRQTVLQLVARISSRVFLGEELCRDPDWLRVTKDYTVATFNAADELRQWPKILRPIVNRFLPSCLTAQAMVKEARTIIRPIIAKRYAARDAAAAAGEKYVESNDAIDWFARADSERHFDGAMFQLALSLAAIHTTTDLLSETLLRIAKNPEVIPALRKEIIEIYRSDGWEKTALYKMKLLDSTIKETQRIKPISLGRGKPC